MMFQHKYTYFLGRLLNLYFLVLLAVAKITGKKFPISAIRVKKFCANSVYGSAIASTGFIPPTPLMEAIEKTIRFEFFEDHKAEQVFHSD